MGFLRGVGDGAHIEHRLARIGHVDHRGHHHEAGHAELVGAVHVAQRFARAGFGHVGQHRDAAVGGFQRDLRDLQLFFQRQRAGFAERAAGDEAVDAVADLEVDMTGRALCIDALVGVELGGDGGEDALPAGIAHLIAPCGCAVVWKRRTLNILRIYGQDIFGACTLPRPVFL